tara:strand:+ start:12065 stop:12880 length:816 start_codon:yes stop_codon:yes gene_type:complete
MPPKKKVPEGELTAPELRKLIRAHNKLTKITIPKGTDREGIINIVEQNGYKVNHKMKRLDAQVKRGKSINLKKADEILPKPKTKEQKESEKKARDMKKKGKDDTIKAEGVRQGAALQRVIAKRNQGKLNKLKVETTPEFKTKKQVINYFNKQLESFRKSKVLVFVKRIKDLSDTKQIQDERKQLVAYGNKNVLEIIELNDELIEDEDYEELDEKFEAVLNIAKLAVGKRMDEINNLKDIKKNAELLKVEKARQQAEKEKNAKAKADKAKKK